jgi:hypothetical protein
MRSATVSLGCMLAACAAQAEPVFVRSGTSLGQGWVFPFQAHCWLATPKHVIRPDAGMIVVGPNGMQGFSLETSLHPSEDLALVKLGGELADKCPTSPRGDLDSLPAIKRAFSEGQEVAFERRQFDEETGQAGIDIIPSHIIAVPEVDSMFMIRPSYPEEDPVVQSDSGSPVRMRGSGIGGSGYPIGIIVQVTDTGTTQYVEVLKMDRVRKFVEDISSAKRKEPTEADIAFMISSFSGTTSDTDCGPANLLIDTKACGWRVQRSLDRTYPSLTVKLAMRREVSSATIRFRDAEQAKGISVTSRLSNGTWTTSRYCPATSSPAICRIPVVETDEIRIVIDAKKVEIDSVKID